MPYITYRSPSHWLSRHPLDRRIDVGEHTYFDRDITFALFRDSDRVSIGRYCSIARGTVIFGGGNHYFRRATTFPFQAFGVPVPEVGEDGDVAPSPETRIGSDVWLGYAVRVMPGATIGHGAVVGSSAVVCGDVPPYAVVGGNPATVLSARFDRQTVERLLELAWWEWPTAKVLANVPLLMRSAESWSPDQEFAEGAPEGSHFPVESRLQVAARHTVARLRERPYLARLLRR